MSAGQQRRQRGGLRADPDRASWPQRPCHHRIGGDWSPGGRRARLGHGFGGEFGGGGFGGTGLVRGIGGGIRHVTAGVHRAGHIGEVRVIDMPTPTTTSRHQLVLRDLRWWRRLHIHHLTTHPRGLRDTVQRPRTPGTATRGNLERLIRVFDHTPRRRPTTGLLARLATRPAPG
jgi:hypothetical protein